MKHWQVKASVVLASLIIGLVVAELGLRILGIEYPNFYDYDPHLGHTLQPGTQAYWLKEGGGYVSINSDGLRDREHSIRRPPNTLRIAILGDSYAEAMHVNQEEAFWAIMGKELQSCKNLQGRNIEVINFGVAGFGTTQELLILRHKVWKYSPDIVLLAFCTGNDIADNSRALNQRDTNPFYVFEGNELVLVDTRTKRAGEKRLSFQKKRNWLVDFYIWLRDTSRIMQVIQHFKNIAWEWRSPKDSEGMPGSVRQGSEAGIFIDIYREPTDEVWQEAWRVTEGVLLKMRDEVAQKGARFFVVVLTNGSQVHPDLSLRTAHATWPGVDDLFYPDRRVERFCQSHDIPVLLLATYFQDYATQHNFFSMASGILSGVDTGIRMAIAWPDLPSPSGCAPNSTNISG